MPAARGCSATIIRRPRRAKIRNTSDLYRALDGHRLGDTVELQVRRNGDVRKVAVTLQKLPRNRRQQQGR